MGTMLQLDPCELYTVEVLQQRGLSPDRIEALARDKLLGNYLCNGTFYGAFVLNAEARMSLPPTKRSITPERLLALEHLVVPAEQVAEITQLPLDHILSRRRKGELLVQEVVSAEGSKYLGVRVSVLHYAVKQPVIPSKLALLVLTYQRTRTNEDLNTVLAEGKRLVMRSADYMKRRAPPFIDVGDLISAGYDALLKSVQKYDDTETVVFETFAIGKVRNAMLDFMRTEDHLSNCYRQHLSKILSAEQSFFGEHGRKPTLEELAEATRIPQRIIGRVLSCDRIFFPRSLNAKRKKGLSEERDDTIDERHASIPTSSETPLQQLLREENAKEFGKYVKRALSEREQEIADLYIQQDLTLAEVGRFIGVSEARVSQIFIKIRKKLMVNAQRFNPYDGKI